MKQTFLPGGRGVRYEILPTDMVEKILATAFAKLTADGGNPSALELQRLATRNGARAMVKQVTKSLCRSAADQTAAKADPAAWRTITDAEYAVDEEWAKLFGTKEEQLLSQVYDREHNVSQAEVNDVLGKATEV